MIAIRINGSESPVRSEGMSRIADVIELIKSSIDPEHMITRLVSDGREFDETVWNASTNQFQTSVIEVETDTPETYIEERMKAAPDVVRYCLQSFADSRAAFEQGDSFEGNRILGEAVDTFNAFCQWYGSLTELVPVDLRPNFSLNSNVEGIGEICKRICQQQLYQSWWALSETMKNELEPALAELEEKLRTFSV